MNQDLWNNVSAYDFDKPPSEYGFSTRLAHENYWTIGFTAQAILEYKKFMYLAAVSDFMVAPSSIVDQVWHQHLIFTQSYRDFCVILGKQIQHIPSTHNKADFEKFEMAKERTSKLYELNFGAQPGNIWSYGDMYESLHMQKARYKLRSTTIFGLFVSIVCTAPAYFILRSIYIRIDNPDFLWGFAALMTISFFLLEFSNKIRLRNIVSGFDPASFVYNLNALEVVCLHKQSFTHVANAAVNELVENGTIKVNSDDSIELAGGNPTNDMQHQIISSLSELGATHYPILLSLLRTKPIFRNIPRSMDAFQKYFNKSKKFERIYYTNFSLLALLMIVLFTRIVTGVLRDKPI